MNKPRSALPGSPSRGPQFHSTNKPFRAYTAKSLCLICIFEVSFPGHPRVARDAPFLWYAAPHTGLEPVA